MISLPVVAQMDSFLWYNEWLKQKALLLWPLRLTFCKWTIVLSILTKLHIMKSFNTFCEARRPQYKRESKRQTHLVQRLIWFPR